MFRLSSGPSTDWKESQSIPSHWDAFRLWMVSMWHPVKESLSPVWVRMGWQCLQGVTCNALWVVKSVIKGVYDLAAWVWNDLSGLVKGGFPVHLKRMMCGQDKQKVCKHDSDMCILHLTGCGEKRFLLQRKTVIIDFSCFPCTSWHFGVVEFASRFLA